MTVLTDATVLGPEARDIRRAGDYFRLLVETSDAGAQAAVQRAWAVADAAIQVKVDGYLAKVAAAQAAGTPITENWAYQVGRLDQLRAFVAAQYARVGVVVNRSTMSAQGQAISDAQDATQRLLGAMFDGTPLDARVDFASLSHEAIDLMVGTLQTGSPLRDLTFSNLSVAGAESVARALVAGFVAGEPIRQVAKRVDLERNMTHARALTIARTETLRTLRESSLLVMSRNSHLLQGWRWSARFDGHTCGVCVALQGSLHDTLEPMDTHPNCRCSPVPQTKSWEDLGYPGIPDTSPELPTADRWLKMMRDKDLVRAFGPSRAALIRDGYLRPQDLVSHVDRGRWGKQPTLTSVAMAQRIAMDRGWKPKAPTEVKPPDQPYIGKGASIGNLEAWAHQQFPHLATVNLNGLDPSVVAPALKELARLHERYPGVFSRVETLRVAQAGRARAPSGPTPTCKARNWCCTPGPGATAPNCWANCACPRSRLGPAGGRSTPPAWTPRSPSSSMSSAT